MSRNINLNTIKERYIKKHGQNKFDNLNWSNAEYISIHKPINNLLCIIHNQLVSQHANNLIYNGNGGCPQCITEHKSNCNPNKKSLIIFRNEYIKIFGIYKHDKLNWCDSSYNGALSSVDNLICKIHNEPIMSCPKDLLKSATGGCLKCGNESLSLFKSITLEEYKNRYISVFGMEQYNNLDWANAAHTGVHYPITNLVCKKHNQPILTASKSLLDTSSGGCKLCKIKWKKQDSWLDHISVPNNHNNRQVVISLNDNIKTGKICVDGLIDNTIYEFWGDYWHGNPNKYTPDIINKVNHKTMGHLHEETQLKRQRIINAGYNLVEIWESEWDIISSEI